MEIRNSKFGKEKKCASIQIYRFTIETRARRGPAYESIDFQCVNGPYTASS